MRDSETSALTKAAIAQNSIDRLTITFSRSGLFLPEQGVSFGGAPTITSNKFVANEETSIDLSGPNSKRQSFTFDQIGNSIVYADIETSTVGSSTDYYSMGTWIRGTISAGSIDSVTAGVFMHSPVTITSSADLGRQSSMATYSGSSRGLVSYGSESYTFTSDVELAVDFDTEMIDSNRLARVSGTLNNFVYGESGDTLPDNPITSMSLDGSNYAGHPQTQQFPNTVSHGTSTVSFTRSNGETGGGSEWGGQFYGSNGELFGGGFDASNPSSGIVMTGVFAAEKE